MRIGCDGSRETLEIRKLLMEGELNVCHHCGVVETRQHILTECGLYARARNSFIANIQRDIQFREALDIFGLLNIVLYGSRF